VSVPVVKAVTGWVARRRRHPRSRPGQRAGTVHTQVVLVLRWLRHRLNVRTLAADAGLSIATAYRYLHESLEVVATYAPDLREVLTRAHGAGLAFLCLDGTLVPTDRVGARAEVGYDLWFPGKHRRHRGSVQVLTDPSGFPLWVSDVHPGLTHDLTAARELVLPTLYSHAARGLPVLTDKGYTGAGIGIGVPVKRHLHGPLHTDNHCYNARITALRAPTERGNALLGRWRALDRVTVCPQRIKVITAAAFVPTSLDRATR
jgi:hypothetical protein